VDSSARDDLEVLLDPLLRFAQDALRKYGEFYPFGNSMTAEGQVQLEAAATESEMPPSDELIELLIAGLRGQAAAGRIRAAGICWDSRITDADTGAKKDAIAVSLEHEAGETVLLFMPYAKGRFSGWRFDDLIRQQSEPRIFGTA
jgi:hypothetical protein